jgi:hypothetical protein
MKLTNKIALISGLGCLALVGSGFAAWVSGKQYAGDDLVTVTWNTDVKDVAAYDAMKTALSGAKMVITFTATAAAVD